MVYRDSFRTGSCYRIKSFTGRLNVFAVVLCEDRRPPSQVLPSVGGSGGAFNCEKRGKIQRKRTRNKKTTDTGNTETPRPTVVVVVLALLVLVFFGQRRFFPFLFFHPKKHDNRPILTPSHPKMLIHTYRKTRKKT